MKVNSRSILIKSTNIILTLYYCILHNSLLLYFIYQCCIIFIKFQLKLSRYYKVIVHILLFLFSCIQKSMTCVLFYILTFSLRFYISVHISIFFSFFPIYFFSPCCRESHLGNFGGGGSGSGSKSTGEKCYSILH